MPPWFRKPPKGLVRTSGVDSVRGEAGTHYSVVLAVEHDFDFGRDGRLCRVQHHTTSIATLNGFKARSRSDEIMHRVDRFTDSPVLDTLGCAPKYTHRTSNVIHKVGGRQLVYGRLLVELMAFSSF